MRSNTGRQKLEFSKKLFIAVAILNVIIVAFSFVMMWRTNSVEPLIYLIPAAFAEFATATGFYYSKAKRENEIKLRKKYGMDIYNDTKEGGHY